MTMREFWKKISRLTKSVIDGHLHDHETALLRSQHELLRTLAFELRVPLPNIEGGYAEITVRRLTLAEDRWEITDGATSNRKVWVDDDWHLASDIGLGASHQYTLDEALAVAHQVAEYEGAALEVQARAYNALHEGKDSRG